MNTKILIAGTALLALSSAWILTPTPAQGEFQPDRPALSDEHVGGPLVSVTATGRVNATPNRASVSVGATAQAETAAAAIEQVNSTMNELIDQLRALDLPNSKMQTSSIQLYPVYGPQGQRDGEPRIIGYRASNSVTVRTDDVKRVGEVMDLAARLGANQINGPMFELQDADGVQRDALRLAVAEAKRKAQAIAEEMDMKIVRWEEISESGAMPPRPMMYGGEMMAMRADVSTPVEAGEIETAATVTLVARLAD